MFSLAAEVIDNFVEFAFVKHELTLGDPFTTERFQPMYVVVFAFLWVVLRQSLLIIDPKMNANRVIGILHAVSMVSMGVPVIRLLTSKSFNYYDMFDSFVTNRIPLTVTCNLMCYASVGYFLMDSYFLVRKAYLKHHIGAIMTWVAAAYHHETSLIHGVCVICLFECGAILVQLSRAFPENLIWRTLVCMGYTFTRLSLAWYYGFIWVTTSINFPNDSLFVKLGYPIIWAGLLFLIVLNAKWTMMQWQALIKAYKKRGDSDFFTYHQQIIGNGNPYAAPPPAQKID